MRTVTFFIILAIVALDVQGGQFYKTSEGRTCYIETVSEFSWFEAYFECSYRNMSLFTFESQAQFDDLYQLLTSDKFTNKPPAVWLGAIGVKGKFLWIKTRQPMTAHHLWKPGNPDNSGGNENCLHISMNRQVFNDLVCTDKLGFVCEMDDIVVTSPKDEHANGSGGASHDGKYKGLTINFVNQNN